MSVPTRKVLGSCPPHFCPANPFLLPMRPRPRAVPPRTGKCHTPPPDNSALPPFRRQRNEHAPARWRQVLPRARRHPATIAATLAHGSRHSIMMARASRRQFAKGPAETSHPRSRWPASFPPPAPLQPLATRRGQIRRHAVRATRERHSPPRGTLRTTRQRNSSSTLAGSRCLPAPAFFLRQVRKQHYLIAAGILGCVKGCVRPLHQLTLKLGISIEDRDADAH